MSAVLSKSNKERSDAITLRLDEYKETGALTHNLHPYPAKFIPQIPNEIISKLTDPGDWILDPFCGSGTTLVESTLLGRHSVGTDVNPLSCKISSAKVSRFTAAQLVDLNSLLSVVAEPSALARIPARLPEFFGRDKWFSPTSQRELAALLNIIRKISDESVRNFAEVVLSSIIVKVSNQESDTRYKAIDKEILPDRVRQAYVTKLRDAISRAEQYVLESTDVSARVWQLDSTTEQAPVTAKFKLAITSPPYMNSYDYYLYHKHRLNWLGLDVASTQEREFGSRNKHNDKGLGVEVYNEAVSRSIRITRDQLTKDGLYCVIVGDAIWQGNLIKMNANYDDLFQAAGYKKVREIAFPQRKYTRSFTANMRTAHKDSYVLIYARR